METVFEPALSDWPETASEATGGGPLHGSVSITFSAGIAVEETKIVRPSEGGVQTKPEWMYSGA
jgi:hypothetical protein